jgi:hypothetical protein
LWNIREEDVWSRVEKFAAKHLPGFPGKDLL